MPLSLGMSCKAFRLASLWAVVHRKARDAPPRAALPCLIAAFVFRWNGCLAFFPNFCIGLTKLPFIAMRALRKWLRTVAGRRPNI